MTKIGHLTGVEKQVFLTNELKDYLACLDNPQEYVTFIKEPGRITLVCAEKDDNYESREYALWQDFAFRIERHFQKRQYSNVRYCFHDRKIEIFIVEDE